jgi:hypothetical protein
MSTSHRLDVADAIALKLYDYNLNDAYGVQVGQSHVKGKPYVVTFCKAAITDGTVVVYGEKFILVKWQSRRHDVAHTGQEKFTSVDDAMAFIKESFA